ncbi:MAG: PEP-CTERM sorting domain-containing protein [Acidobacteria bacterium]|nr:PEP-CTERM sorting domain-containing protein [Acidobacteriota bacterium]
MSKPRVLTSLVSMVFLLTLVSSVRADRVHQPPGLEKFNFRDIQTLDLPAVDRANLSDFLSEHFANNNGNHFGFVNALDAITGTSASGFAGNAFAGNGKHLGFSVSAVRSGVKFGLANPRRPNTTVTENPEPTGILLLGTGLAAGAAFARRIRRRRLTEKR